MTEKTGAESRGPAEGDIVEVAIWNAVCPRCGRRMDVTNEQLTDLLAGKVVRAQCACGLGCTILKPVGANA